MSANQFDTNVELGRFLHEMNYSKNRKEISFGSVNFDIVKKTKNKLIIGENKKSSRYTEASKMQLGYYLRLLHELGVEAEGVLLYPSERKKEKVLLTEDLMLKLDKQEKEIISICKKDIPPQKINNKYCKQCAYNEYCFS